MKFSKRELELSANILGNISVAWFTAGVISPLLLKKVTGYNVLFSILSGIVLSGLFAAYALSLIK